MYFYEHNAHPVFYQAFAAVYTDSSEPLVSLSINTGTCSCHLITENSIDTQQFYDSSASSQQSTKAEADQYSESKSSDCVQRDHVPETASTPANFEGSTGVHDPFLTLKKFKIPAGNNHNHLSDRAPQDLIS